MGMQIISDPQRKTAAEDLIKAFDFKFFKTMSEPVRMQILKILLLNGRSDIATIAENMPQDRSVISRIKKNEAKIRELSLANKNMGAKRQRKPEGAEIEDALQLWFKQVRAKNVPVNGPILLEKAIQLANQLNSSFIPNSSWIDRFKLRNNINFQKIHGEKKSADPPKIGSNLHFRDLFKVFHLSVYTMLMRLAYFIRPCRTRRSTKKGPILLV